MQELVCRRAGFVLTCCVWVGPAFHPTIVLSSTAVYVSFGGGFSFVLDAEQLVWGKAASSLTSSMRASSRLSRPSCRL